MQKFNKRTLSRVIDGINVNKMKLLGKYLFKVKCKWESKVKGDVNSPPQDE
jgi:hypothetical protein